MLLLLRARRSRRRRSPAARHRHDTALVRVFLEQPHLLQFPHILFAQGSQRQGDEVGVLRRALVPRRQRRPAEAAKLTPQARRPSRRRGRFEECAADEGGRLVREERGGGAVVPAEGNAEEGAEGAAVVAACLD